MYKRMIILLFAGCAGTALGKIQLFHPEKQEIVDELLKTKKCVGCDLAEVFLNDAELAGADLRKAHLSPSGLGRANLENANLSEANMHNSDLKKANLKNANLRGTNLSGSTMNNADLQNANLENANLASANLDGANLEGANLTGVNLGVAYVKNANLKNAKLTGAKLGETQCNKTTILPAGFACVDKEIQPICNNVSDCNKYLPSFCHGRCVCTKGKCDKHKELEKYVGEVKNEGMRMLKTWNQLCNADYKDKCQGKCKAYPEDIILSGTKYCWLP